MAYQKWFGSDPKALVARCENITTSFAWGASWLPLSRIADVGIRTYLSYFCCLSHVQSSFASVLKLNSFWKTAAEAICSKTKSPLFVTWKCRPYHAESYQHERPLGRESKPEILSDNQNIFSMNLVKNQIVHEPRRLRTKVWLSLPTFRLHSNLGKCSYRWDPQSREDHHCQLV